MEIRLNRHNPHYWTKDSSANYSQLLCLRASPSVWQYLILYKRNITSVSMTTFLTAGGRIACKQCEGTSRRTKERCKAPAAKGKTKCRFHGGASTGPKTLEGRQRCAEAKTIHGNETRKARTERALAMRRLRALEDLGHALGLMEGARTPGRKPN